MMMIMIIIIKIRHAVHSICSDSITTNLDIFLSCSLSFLLLDGWRSYSHKCFLSLWRSKNVLAHCHMSSFYDFEESETLSSPNRILRDTGTKLFKIHNTRKTGTNLIPICMVAVHHSCTQGNGTVKQSHYRP
jgi:hypothetical protein